MSEITLEDLDNESTEEIKEQPEPEQAEPAAEAAPEAPEPEETTSTGEDKDSTPESTQDKQEWTLSAVMAEREKRQKLEKELEEYRSREQQQPRPDVFEDQEGAFAYIENRVEVARAEDRFALSREMMSMLKDDYETREQEFIELAQSNPEYVTQLRASPNPARFAYETAIRHQEMAQLQNVDEYKSKLRAELKAELQKEMEAERAKSQEDAESKRAAMTPSLAGQRSVSGTKEPAPSVNPTLDDIM